MWRVWPDDAAPPPSLRPPARASAAIDGAAINGAAMNNVAASASRPDWRERWVEVAQVSPPAPRTPGKMVPADLAAEVNDAPVVTPGRVMLALLAIVLVLGFVELLFRSTIPDWRQRRDRR